MGLFSGFFKKKLQPTNEREILPADEMKRKYNLSIDNYTPRRLDAKKVPQEFRDLVPLAEKWGIGDDIIRDDQCQKASQEEKKGLATAIGERGRAIGEWLDTFGNGKMTDEAAAFLYTLEALEEMVASGDLGPEPSE